MESDLACPDRAQPSLPFESHDDRRLASYSMFLTEGPGAPDAESGPPSFVRRRRAKRYIVHVRDDGHVCVTIPRGGSLREGRAFVSVQHRWIAQRRAELDRARAARPAALPPEHVKVLRHRAVQELPVRVFAMAARFGLTVARVSIRSQRSRWGSCSHRAHISLNWRLIAMPDAVRDYIIVHELMHLKRMDHSPAFWKLVAAACPGYRDARRWLARAPRSVDSP